MTKTGTKRMGMVCANRDHDLSKCKIENGSYHFLPFFQNHFEGLTCVRVFTLMSTVITVNQSVEYFLCGFPKLFLRDKLAILTLMQTVYLQ